MKYIFTFLLFLFLLMPAWATPILVPTLTIPNFQVTGLGNSTTGTATVTNGVATVTSSAAFPARLVGLQGYKIVLGGFEYEALSTDSTSALTLTQSYAGASGSVAFTIYPVVLLQIYASQPYFPLGASYPVLSGARGSQGFYKKIACSFKYLSGVPSLVIPPITLDAISDAPNNADKSARLSAYFFRVEGGEIRPYDGFQDFTLTASPTTQQWEDIRRYNNSSARAILDSSTLTRSQIYDLLNNFNPNISGTYRRLGMISATGTGVENSALSQDGSGNIAAGANLAAGGTLSAGGNITTSGDLIGATPEYATAGRPTCNAANVRRRIRLTDGYEGIQTCVNTQGSVYEWVNDKPFLDVLEIGASPSSSAAVNGLYLNVALDRVAATSGGKVKLPCGNFSFDTTLTFDGNYTVVEGEGDCTTLTFTSSGNAINVNARQMCEIQNLRLIKSGSRGSVGIYLERVSHSTAVRNVYGANWNEFIQFNSTFYTLVEDCRIYDSNIGINLRSEAKGNQILRNKLSECNLGILLWDVAPAVGPPVSGAATENVIAYNVIEASPGLSPSATFAIEIAGGAANQIIGNRLEYTVGTAHMGEDAGTMEIATKNTWTDNKCVGTISAFRFGNGSGTGQVVGSEVVGGSGINVVINGDADNIKMEATKGSYTGTWSDAGRGSNIDVDSSQGLTYRKNPGTTDIVWKLVVGGTSTVTDYGPNYESINFTGLSDAFRRSRINVGGTETAVSRHGAYRFWVDASGNFRQHTADPTSLTDGLFFLTSTRAETIAGVKTFSASPVFNATVNFKDSTISAPASGSWQFTPGASSDGDMFFSLASGKSLFTTNGKLGLTGSRWQGIFSTDATFSGVLAMDGMPQTLTGAGAVNLTTDTTLWVTTGANAGTLPAGSAGQTKTITMITDGGDGTLSPTNPIGYTTITFTAIGQSVTLKYLNSKWVIVGYWGVTIA